MKYKDRIRQEMLALADNCKVRFIGYNTKLGHQMYGTLKGCEESCIETPIAENLMMGLAMGMSLEGFLPVVCFERSNFLLPALDAIVNHLHAMPKMSKEFNFRVILRVVIPTDKPLDPGIQHLGDFSRIIEQYTDIPRIEYVPKCYSVFLGSKYPVCIVEKKELYETDCLAKAL